MIEVKGLSKFYGDFAAIKNLSFEIPSGQIAGLLGLNGAGKSTILKILATYLSPTYGEIGVGGFQLQNQIEDVRRIIGYLPDTPPLYGEMRVREYLSFAARLRGVEKSSVLASVDKAMENTQISDVKDVLLNELSHGYRQRVGIAQAIVHEPKLIILDEPINGLDPIQIVGMRDLIVSFRGQYTVILSSHILSEITRTCDNILIIDQGKLVAEGSEEELKKGSILGSHVKIRFRGDASSVMKSIKSSPLIKTLTEGRDSEGHEWVVEGSEDIRSFLAQSVIQGGGDLLGLETVDQGLEALFVKLVKSGDA